MITLKKAYEIASEKSLCPLAKKAYDLGDCWTFDCAEETTGFRPPLVRKTDGALLEFNFPSDFGRIAKAKIVYLRD